MLFHRRRAARRLEDELSFHLEHQIAENIAAGMSAEEARFAALRSFGNPALLREEARATWTWTGIETSLREVRYGLRTLRRTPGFTAIAILVMALGIGANVALFTVVRSVLLKPLPYPQSDRLVAIFEHNPDKPGQINPYLPVATGSFWEWQRAVQGSAEMAADFALAGLQRLRGERQASGTGARRLVYLESAAHAGRTTGTGALLHGSG